MNGDVSSAGRSRARVWKRRFKQLMVGLVAVALIVVAGIALLWRLAADRLNAESELVETPGGPMEVAALGRPEDPPILVLHGSPGGYDQLLPLARTLADGGYRVFAVSRPGYLRTPQGLGTTPPQQADALATLLHRLDVDPVVVVGVSGGGPSTLQLALRHPDRVRALVLICAVTGRPLMEPQDPAQVTDFGLAWDLGALAARWSPALALRLLGVEDAEERRRLLQDTTTRESVEYLFQSLGFSSRRRGYKSDLQSFAASELGDTYSQLELPILLLHGSEDESVLLGHSQRVANQAPQADLRVLEGAGHAFFVLRRDWLDAQIFDFLDGLRDQLSGDVQRTDQRALGGSETHSISSTSDSGEPASRSASVK